MTAAEISSPHATIERGLSYIKPVIAKAHFVTIERPEVAGIDADDVQLRCRLS